MLSFDSTNILTLVAFFNRSRPSERRSEKEADTPAVCKERKNNIAENGGKEEGKPVALATATSCCVDLDVEVRQNVAKHAR